MHNPIPFIQVGWGGRVKCRQLVDLLLSILHYERMAAMFEMHLCTLCAALSVGWELTSKVGREAEAA